jgi:hypothetical protein
MRPGILACYGRNKKASSESAIYEVRGRGVKPKAGTE